MRTVAPNRDGSHRVDGLQRSGRRLPASPHPVIPAHDPRPPRCLPRPRRRADRGHRLSASPDQSAPDPRRGAGRAATERGWASSGVIVTNQSGVGARPVQPGADGGLQRPAGRRRWPRTGRAIDAVYACPFHAEGSVDGLHPSRPSGPQAQPRHDPEGRSRPWRSIPTRSLLIGDRVGHGGGAAGRRAGLPFRRRRSGPFRRRPAGRLKHLFVQPIGRMGFLTAMKYCADAHGACHACQLRRTPLDKRRRPEPVRPRLCRRGRARPSCRSSPSTA